MDEINRMLAITCEQVINNQAMLRIMLIELAKLKANSGNGNKKAEQIFEELMNDVNSERDKIAKSKFNI